MKKTVYLIALLTILTGAAFGTPAALFEIQLIQRDTVMNVDIPIINDTFTIVKGIDASGFLGPASVDISLNEIDSLKTVFTVHVVTLSSMASNVSRNYSVEYELPARVDDLYGKNQIKYAAVIKPLRYLDVDTTHCSMNHRKRDLFNASPTAYTDIFYLPNSYGDYYWNTVKELAENNYRQLKDLLHFSLPGKYAIYLAPCPLYSILWDNRFGIMCDPTRNNSFAIFNKSINTFDPFLVNHTAILKNFGYAPLILSEGLANYYSFHAYDIKKIKTENKLPPLDSLLNSITFYRDDPFMTDRAAASLVRYLVDSYGLDRFLRMYKRADDGNLPPQLMKSYDLSLAAIEENWHQYIDTVTITPKQFAEHLYKLELLQQYDNFLHIANLAMTAAGTAADSVQVYQYLKRGYFFTGNYYEAKEMQAKVLSLIPEDIIGQMALGSYTMMNGDYDEAMQVFEDAQSKDTANQMIRFNRAMLSLILGDTTVAKELLLNNLSNQKGALAQNESKILLGQILFETNKEAATHYYTQAINAYQQGLQINNASPALYLWSAIGRYGLGEYDAALDLLSIAEFLEKRPFYQGMINLWIGKSYLKLNELQKAKEHLQVVISLAATVYHTSEAKTLLTQIP